MGHIMPRHGIRATMSRDFTFYPPNKHVLLYVDDSNYHGGSHDKYKNNNNNPNHRSNANDNEIVINWILLFQHKQ